MNNYTAQIKITLKKGILDVQGKAVEQALHSMEYTSITEVRIGKLVELKVQAENQVEAKNLVNQASEKLIANPIIEDFNIEIFE